MDFLETLMKKIVAGKDLPKVQVERYISPILEIFIEDILTEYYNNDKIDENDKRLKGKYKLIAPEFPLQKFKNFIDEKGEKNHLSTNIDYLLVNTTKKKLVFLELKTDSSSYKEAQLDIYKKLQKKNLKTLIEDACKIEEASAKKGKYRELLKLCKNNLTKIDIDQIKSSEIIYLVPSKVDFKVDMKNTITLNNLPQLLPSNGYKTEWELIRKSLCELDTTTKCMPLKEFGKIKEELGI